MSRHRFERVTRFAGTRRKALVLGVLGAGVSVGLVATMLPLIADDDLAITAVADTTATAVPQDGDNSAKSTLATCPERCDNNPRGGRDGDSRLRDTGVATGPVRSPPRRSIHAGRP